jgi:hypothetical protein
MRVEVHDAFKKAQSIPATRVVVYDEYDNPIAAVVQVEGGQYVAVTAAMKQFQAVLKAMGINKTLIVEHIDSAKLQPLM